MVSPSKANANLVQHLTKQSASTLSKVAPKTVLRAMLLAEETYTTPIMLMLVDRYGSEALSWAPETIRRELEEDFQLKLPKYTLDKIMSGISLITTNYFYKDVTKFVEICNILAGDEFQPDEFEPADTGEILFGITEALLLWPPNDDKEDTEFSAEIQEYIRQVMQEEGIYKPFDVLRFAIQDDTASKIDADYADDPEMYQAIFEMQQSKENELKTMLYENIEALTKQVELLPLKSGDTKKVVESLKGLLSNK